MLQLILGLFLLKKCKKIAGLQTLKVACTCAWIIIWRGVVFLAVICNLRQFTSG